MPAIRSLCARAPRLVVRATICGEPFARRETAVDSTAARPRSPHARPDVAEATNVAMLRSLGGELGPPSVFR
jgi:hypothetical protein